MRRSLVAVVAGFLVVAGLQAQPASAASKTPAKVQLVSFVKASYERSSNKASLSLDWPDASRAKKYEIFVSKSYSMKSAKVYTQKSSKTTIRNLSRGKDYFVQVRGVNGKKHGSKSSVVGHTAIVRPGGTGALMPLRVMTYNVCSRVCDDNGYPWLSRQPAVWERAAASGADVIATQEADNLAAIPNYTLAVSFSAKKLWYNSARFYVPEAATPAPPAGPLVSGCRVSSDFSRPTGNVYLGRHGGGCRYAVWAELVERSTGRSVLAVDVHTVSGTTKETTNYRRDEINTMLSAIKQVNTKGLPVFYAGDFNSHKESSTSDSVRPVMHASKLYDSFDLARALGNQHVNSYQGFRSTPAIGLKWGNHIDKVWVDPYKVRVDGWYNHGLIGANGKFVQPAGSDHLPVVVDLRIG